LEQDADFFDKNSPNEMSAKLMVNAEELFDGTGTNFALCCQLLLASFGSFVVILIISPYLFLAFLGFMLITFTVLGVIMGLWMNGI
jgi:ABC-type multidrug transport system fused ATPase/permease subunit